MKKSVFITMLCMLPFSLHAQLSSNPYKFLGNITTSYNVDAGGGLPKYYELWNQITCENESKWSSVEGNRGNFNWGSDKAFNYAIEHNFTYKFHALVWGAQYPGWLDSLTPKERFAALTNWFNHAKAKYNTLPMIDVVNEAVGSHQPGNPMIKETLGGGGKTGYDWLIKAFDMAGQRWPDAILIYNDYNSLRWDVDNYIDLVRTLRDAGAPIDAYGNQSHDVDDISETELSNVLEKQQNALKMPMFITELDINKQSDAQQKAQYQKVLPLMWEAPYCAGVTLWGYVYGRTWVSHSGLYKDGKERPAMTWIKEYMESDAAKNAVGPLPGTKKEASIYIRPAALKVLKDETFPIKVHARLATKQIEKVELYVNDELVKTMTEAPYIAEYTPTKTNWNNTKAVVTATDGSTYERYGRFHVTASKNKHEPYSETIPELPGTIKIDEYDKGATGVNFNNASRNVTTTMKDGQWMEYTVDVKEDGEYSFDATVASSSTGGRFHLAEYGLDSLSYLTEFVEVPKTGGNSKWKTLHGRLLLPLTAGRHVFTLMVGKGGFCIQDITLSRYEKAEGISCRLKGFSQNYGVGDVIPVEMKVTAKNSPVGHVSVYANDLLVGTSSEEPYTVNFKPDAMDTYTIKAIVTDVDGKEMESAERSLVVDSPKPTAIRTVTSEASNASDGTVYNLMGVPVGAGYRGIVIKNGKKVVIK